MIRDVVIIGGGVIGASVAYHLAAGGCTNVTILEREAEPGAGSTSKATGGFRSQFGTEIGVRLSLLSREKLSRFKDEFGVDPGYRPCGYLFLATSEPELNGLRSALAVQRQAGLSEVIEVSPDEIYLYNPFVTIDGIRGGTFCQTDGYIQPMQILRGYIDGARRLGVTIEMGVECRGFTKETGDSNDSRISAVRTSAGEIPCGAVVNAAGAWAGVIAQQAGINLSVTPVKRQVAVTEETSVLPEEIPMTIFAEDGFHFRVRDRRVMLLKPVHFASADPFEMSFDESWLDLIRTRIRERVPPLAGIAFDRSKCIAGLYEMTPDRTVILGRAPGLENFYLVNGSSGHGVMHSPALGQLVAECILDGTVHSIDGEPLRPTRFAEGRPNASVEFL